MATDSASTISSGRRFLEELLESGGLARDLMDRPGTSLATTEDRVGSRICVRYVMGDHVVLWHDPELTPVLEPLADTGRSMTENEWMALVEEQGWNFLGGAIMKVFPETAASLADTPSDVTVHQFDWSRDADLALVQALIDVSSEEDLDEAEVEMDDLDDIAFGLLDPDGSIAAYASSRPWDRGDNFGDIGVIVRSDARGRGLGVAVVSVVVAELRRRGIDPLYRCDPENAGSDRLSAALGFEVQTALTAATAPD